MGFWYACSLSFPAHLMPAHTLHTPTPLSPSPAVSPSTPTLPRIRSPASVPSLYAQHGTVPHVPLRIGLSKQIPPLPSETRQSWVHAPGLCAPLAATPVLCAPPAVLHPPLVPSPSWTAPARRARSAVSHVAFFPLYASSRTDFDAYISDYRDRGTCSVP
ncbi:hypothetical protein B0H13DRAFT_2029537, partial [Mycena leptocephala]